MKNAKRKISSKKSLIVLSIVFLMLFFLKASLYGVIGGPFFFDWLLQYIPEFILFVIFLPIYYIFEFPIVWLLSFISVNQFYAFCLDIGLTIVYLTTLYFVFQRIFRFFKKRKNC